MRKLILSLGLTLACAGLAGCATPETPYQPFVAHGEAGIHGGYSEQRLAADRYLVRFHGNSMTSRDRVEDYMLYRAAELTLQNDDDWFVVIERNTEHNVHTVVERDQLYHPWYGVNYGYWQPEWRFYSSGLGWTSWAGSPSEYDVRRIEAFEATAAVQMHKGPVPAGDAHAIDARRVVANLGPTVERPKP
jgi:hypothetical protein